MNWKLPLLGFVAGCLVTVTVIKIAAPPSDTVFLNRLVVEVVDSETGLPVKVTGISYPKHDDFTFSTSESKWKPLFVDEFGSESGVVRIVWVGRGSPEEYEFTFSSSEYEDIVVPSEFIETTARYSSGRLREPAVLPIKPAEQSVPPKSDRAGG